MSDSVWILGTSMTRFTRHEGRDLLDLASEAALGALDDGGVTVQDMDVLACGTLFSANASVGQQLLGQIGQTGVGIYNVANACATGATAVRVALMAIRSGEASLALALGVEKMGKMGLLGSPPKRAKAAEVFEPSGRFGSVRSVDGILGTKTMPGVFGQAGMRYAHDHDGVGFEQFARIAHKNHRHSALNPLAQYRKEFSLEEIKASPMVAYPNTLLMCCPTGDGAAAAVLVSGERLASLSAEQRRRAVKISASVLTSDPYVEGGQVQPDVNTSDPQRRRRRLPAGGCRARGPRPGGVARLLRLGGTHPLRQPAALRARRGGRLHRLGGPVPRRHHARERLREDSSPRGTPSAPPAWRTSTRSPPTCAARRGSGRSPTPGSAWHT